MESPNLDLILEKEPVDVDATYTPPPKKGKKGKKGKVLGASAPAVLDSQTPVDDEPVWGIDLPIDDNVIYTPPPKKGKKGKKGKALCTSTPPVIETPIVVEAPTVVETPTAVETPPIDEIPTVIETPPINEELAGEIDPTIDDNDAWTPSKNGTKGVKVEAPGISIPAVVNDQTPAENGPTTLHDTFIDEDNRLETS
jgi:hypothetical protein